MSSRPKNIFIDVDDTLVRTAGSKRIPIPKAIAKVKELSSQGHNLYLWSTGGEKYAEETAQELSIQHLFKSFLPKPDVYIDDQHISDWKSLQHEMPLD